MPRYRVTAQIIWDFDTVLSKEQATEIAYQHLGNFSNKQSESKLMVRLDQIKEKNQKIRLSEFKPEDIIPFISKEEVKKEYEVNGIKYVVKMNSHRYFLFRECTKCVSCGLVGNKIFLEKNPEDKSCHFNLYGEENGKLILMTKDHIHAKSCGGEDRHSNYQTMCIICNNLKGHSNINLDGLAELRKIYDKNKNFLTKKKLHYLIEEYRAKLSKPWPSKIFKSNDKMTADAIVAICDMAVLRNQSKEMYAQFIYDKLSNNDCYVGCIRKGTFLEPLLIHKGFYMCELPNKEVILINENLVTLSK